MALVTGSQDVAAPRGRLDPGATDAQAKANPVTTKRPQGTGTPRKKDATIWIRNRQRFAIVPQAAIEDERINDRDFRTLAVLCRYQDGEGRAWPGAARFTVIGSEDTFRRALKSLKKAGLLTAEYDRAKHRIIYEINWTDPADLRGATDSETADLPVSAPADLRLDRSTNQTATDQKPAADAAPPVAFRERKDYRAGFAFGEVFREWYGRTYQRPHAGLMLQDAKGLTALLKKVGRDRALVHELSASPAEEIIIGACIVAERNKGQLWFIRNAPLDIGTILNGKHWQRIWDRVIEEGQNLGRIAKTG